MVVTKVIHDAAPQFDNYPLLHHLSLPQDITFLLPEFYQHIGYVDDRSMPLPPLDEEDFLFHSVAERSLSPDKASDFLKGKEDVH